MLLGGVRCVTVASTEEVNGVSGPGPNPGLGPHSSKQRIADYHFRRKYKAKFI